MSVWKQIDDQLAETTNIASGDGVGVPPSLYLQGLRVGFFGGAAFAAKSVQDGRFSTEQIIEAAIEETMRLQSKANGVKT